MSTFTITLIGPNRIMMRLPSITVRACVYGPRRVWLESARMTSLTTHIALNSNSWFGASTF
jgi:hypothetical protein